MHNEDCYYIKKALKIIYIYILLKIDAYIPAQGKGSNGQQIKNFLERKKFILIPKISAKYLHASFTGLSRLQDQNLSRL